MSQPVSEVDTDLARMRIMSARALASDRWPYVSSLLFGLRLVAVTDGSLHTMAVDDGWRLYYEPGFVLSQDPQALATVLLHECLHVMHEHGARFRALGRPDEDHPIWNVAGDAAINEVLDAEGMPWTDLAPVRAPNLDRYGVRPGMTAEEAFFAMVGYRQAHQDEQALGQDCGSASGGAARDYELQADDAQAPSMPEDRKDGVRERVAHDIAAHARSGGSIPGEVLRWADAVLNPVIDWRTALASLVRRHLGTVVGRRDYTYRRPARRQEGIRRAGIDAILPAMRQPMPPRVVCILDTSGSVPDSELREFVAELAGIVRAAGVVGGVGVICCDARAYPVQRIRNAAQVDQLRLEGGGGTDLRAGLAAVADQRPVAQVVVIFTDGHTPWPAHRPRSVEAVVVVLSDPQTVQQVPAWCTVIEKD